MSKLSARMLTTVSALWTHTLR